MPLSLQTINPRSGTRLWERLRNAFFRNRGHNGVFGYDLPSGFVEYT